LLGVSGVTFASGLWGCQSALPGAKSPSGAPSPGATSAATEPALPPAEDFFFLQLSDTHWGFSGPANPEAAATLRSTIATINAVPARPDFVMFTGDLTQTTEATTPSTTRACGERAEDLVAGGLCAPPVVRPLPRLDWHTTDGARAIESLQQHPNVNVFYGHIHQENEHQTARLRCWAKG
jgi:hypothetical protein